MSRSFSEKKLKEESSITIDGLLTIFLYIAVAILSLLFFVLISRKIRPLFKITVECWFCRETLRVPYKNYNSWDCPKCEQYNGFSKDGDYNKPIPSQYSEDLNNKITTAKSTESRNSKDILCDNCNNNQLMKVKHLASFEPTHNDTFDEEFHDYKLKLERIFKLCFSCEKKASSFIKKQDILIQNSLIDADVPLPRVDLPEKPYIQNMKSENKIISVIQALYITIILAVLLQYICDSLFLKLKFSDEVTMYFLKVIIKSTILLVIIFVNIIKHSSLGQSLFDLSLIILCLSDIAIEVYNKKFNTFFFETLTPPSYILFYGVNIFVCISRNCRRKEKLLFERKSLNGNNCHPENMLVNNSLDSMNLNSENMLFKRNVFDMNSSFNHQTSYSTTEFDNSFDDDNFTSISQRKPNTPNSSCICSTQTKCSGPMPSNPLIYAGFGLLLGVNICFVLFYFNNKQTLS